MRSLRYLAPVLVFLLLAAFLLFGLDRNPAEIPSPLIGKPAPSWSLPGLLPAVQPGTPMPGMAPPAAPGETKQAGQPSEGNALSGDALRGAPYLLNVWASWCAPCLQEHPQLIDLAARKLIRIVGMNYKDKPEDAQAWLSKHGDPFSVVVADRDGRTAIDFGVYGVPETFLVDAQGVIRFKQIGALTADAIRNKLLPAIAALPPSPAAQAQTPASALSPR